MESISEKVQILELWAKSVKQIVLNMLSELMGELQTMS